MPVLLSAEGHTIQAAAHQAVVHRTNRLHQLSDLTGGFFFVVCLDYGEVWKLETFWSDGESARSILVVYSEDEPNGCGTF